MMTQQEIYDEMERKDCGILEAKRSLTRAWLLKIASQAKSTADLRAVVLKIIQEVYA